MLRAVRVFRRPVPLPSATDTLSSAISALKVVKTAADIANSTILGNVVSALLICVETAKDARTNKEDADELVARIVRLVLPTINWIHDMNFPQTPVAESLLKDLKDLIPIFEQVTSAMRKITQRNLVFRAVLSLADKENIQQQRRILDNRLQDFHYNSLVRIQMASVVVEPAYRVIEQEEIELLEEVPFPKRALLDLLVEKRINRVSRAQFGADKRLSRVLQYKQDLSEKEFLAQIHRYRSLFHANIAQFRGASNGGHASPTRFIVVDDHPYTIREVLGPDNPCALSVQERVRLALQAAADIYLVCQYLVQNKILFKFNNKPDYTQLRFDATLSKAVFQLPVLGGSGVWGVIMGRRSDASVPLFLSEFFSDMKNVSTLARGQSATLLDIILAPLWHPLHPRNGPDPPHTDPRTTFAAVYEHWNAATATIPERGLWPSLRPMLLPHFAIGDRSQIDLRFARDNDPRLECGDIVCVDYAWSDTSAGLLVDPPRSYTVIPCADSDSIAPKKRYDPARCVETSRCTTIDARLPDDFSRGCILLLRSDLCYYETLDTSLPPPYLGDVSERTMPEDTDAQAQPVRRIFFIVTSIARHISHKIEAWPAKLRTFHIAPREDAYRFHRPPADQDTPHPRGHWSTSSAGACAQGEYVIPAATSEAEFHAYPGVELDGFRVKALADAEPRRVEYKIRVLDERIVTSASAGLA